MSWSDRLQTITEKAVVGLRWLLAPVPLGAIGWGPPTLLGAVVLTCFSYLMMNTILTGRVSSAVRNERPEGFNETMTSDEFRRRLRLSVDMPPAMDKEPFVGVFQVTSSKTPPPFVDLYLELVRRIVRGDRAAEAGDATKDLAWKEIINEHLAGQRSGWLMFTVETRPFSGQRLLDELSKAEPALQTRLSELKESEQIRKFLVRFSELAAQPAQPPLRSVNRINGLVQWLTVWLFWMIAILLLRRLLFLIPLRRALRTSDVDVLNGFKQDFRAKLTEDVAADPEKTAIAYNEQVRAADASSYRTIEFLTTLLPSLGFIGTVVGMGDALLAADGLFGARDKQQQVITQITQQLGYAFDTTLIALLAGLVAGVLVVQCRLWEARTYAALGRTLFAMPAR